MDFWKELDHHLADKGFSSEVLVSLREFIDAPEIPLELPRIIENLTVLLTYLEAIIPLYPEHLTETIHSEWGAACREIRSHPQWPLLAAPLRRKGKMPLRGLYEKYQIYVALWTCPEGVQDRAQYFSLLAHICLAVSILRRRMVVQEQQGEFTTTEIDSFRYSIYRALLNIRNLAEYDNLHILEALPNLTIPPKRLLEILQNGNRLAASVAPLFKYLLNLKKPVHRQSGEGVSRPRPQRLSPQLKSPAKFVGMESNLDADQKTVPLVKILQLPTLENAEADDAEFSGCLPNEGASGVEIAAPVITGADAKKILSPRQKANYARHIKHRLAMQNQRLPNRWETLSVYEISTFLTAVFNLIKRRDKSPYLPYGANPGELACLLTTVFWCGQRLKDATRLHCYRESVQADVSEPGFVTDGGLAGHWWMVPALPARKLYPDAHQKTKTSIVVNAFCLTSGIDVERLIGAYVKYIHRHKYDHLFPRRLEIYEEMVTSFLSSVNWRNGTRLTANRIADYLFDKIARRDGADLTTAMYLTGRHHFLGSNPSYYTAIKVSKLQSVYREISREILEQFFREHPDENVVHNFQPAELIATMEHVGSPFVPNSKTVAELVNELKSKLKGSKTHEPTVLKLMRLHNNITRYTAYMVGFCTGFRAVRDPFLSAAEIDWQSGFATLSDKDNEDRYNSRLIWIPPVCLEQLKLFREHTHNALYRFSLLMPDLYAQLEQPRRKGPGRHMFYVKEDKEAVSYETLNVGPKLLGRGLRKIYALPFNASRHYLRSNFLESGCPVEVINAFMGHFERGEEPFGSFSGMSPLAYRDALKEYLMPLIEAAGWEAMAGLGSTL